MALAVLLLAAAPALAASIRTGIEILPLNMVAGTAVAAPAQATDGPLILAADSSDRAGSKPAASAAPQGADEAAQALEGFDDQPTATGGTGGSSETAEALEGLDDEPAATAEADDELGGFGDDDAATAAGDATDDDELVGFEDEPAESTAPAQPSLAQRIMVGPWWRISGAVSGTTVLAYAHQAPPPGATDWRGLTSLLGELDLEVEFELPGDWEAVIGWRGFYDAAYFIKGRDNFTGPTLDQYESESELREVYVQGEALPGLDLKIGRQIVVWGKSDNVRVTDVLNPLDLRMPGLVDIEDLRLPMTMFKADYYFRSWNVTGIVLPEPRFDKLPAFGSDFYPAPFPPPHTDRPGVGLDNLQYAAALQGVFSGWDVSLNAARFFEHTPHMVTTLTPAGTPGLEQRYSMLWMVGAATNVALGNWLVKGEAAWLDGFEYQALPGEKKSRFDFMAGLEYTGFDDTTISVEWVARTILDYDDRLASGLSPQDRIVFNTVLRLTRSFVNEKYKATGLFSFFGLSGQGGGFCRLQMEYDLADGWTLTTGLVDYLGGNTTSFTYIQDNDRLFAQLKYSF